MSLTLDEVRNIKFRMAKRTGYEVLDVDEFVDQVEASFEQLQEENANLKRQVESLKSTAGSAAKSEPQAAAPATTGPASQAKGERIIVTASDDASAAVVRLVQMSTEQAEKLVAEAEEQAGQIKGDAERTAKQVTTDATTRAERVESEARVNAERIRSDAQTRADRLDRDTEDKRRELFSELEKQRDQLTLSVSELRKFESDFRQNMTNQLRAHIDSLSGARAEPQGDAPKLLAQTNGSQPSRAATDDKPAEDDTVAEAGDKSRAANTSQTPRLDALLGEQG